MARVIAKLPLTIRFDGLHYPNGYRPEWFPIEFPMGNVRWTLLIETQEHHRRKRTAWEHIPPELLDEDQRIYEPGKYWSFGTGVQGNESYGIVVSREELDSSGVEEAVRTFLKLKDINVGTLELVWLHPPEDEFPRWHKDQERRLEWLKRGAPSHAMTVTGKFVGDVLGTMGITNEDAVGVNEHDLFAKEAECIPPEPRAIYESALRELAALLWDTGRIFLSRSSWPTSLTFVAGGRRYHGDEKERRRGWYGYLEGTRQVVIFRSPTMHELIEVSGVPDFLPALDSIER
ncbi:hypothetical protein C4568_04220 [Candidatus Parcubacteria bacterium]|nr:MAG: hypothetical protein C4568_04220 [Candidatus Parcubacteria bacterium]